MIKRLSFIIAVLAVVLFSGCEAIIDAAGGLPYVFDTPTWIQGSWSNTHAAPDEDIWTFTATTVTFTDNAGTVNWNTYGSEIGISITNESGTATTYEFHWATAPYFFEQTSSTTLLYNGFTFTKQ